jgi:hypothetical protein
VYKTIETSLLIESIIVLLFCFFAYFYRTKVLSNGFSACFFVLVVADLSPLIYNATDLSTEVLLDFLIKGDRDLDLCGALGFVVWWACLIIAFLFCLKISRELPRLKRRRVTQAIFFCMLSFFLIYSYFKPDYAQYLAGPYDRNYYYFTLRRLIRGTIVNVEVAAVETILDVYAIPMILHSSLLRGKAGLWKAFLCGGLIFTSFHFFDRNFTWIMAIADFSLYGVFAFSSMYFRSIFPACWIHFFWNFMSAVR